MNNLPDDVIQQIYLYKHNLEFVNVVDQLLQAKINVQFNFSLKQCRIICYVKNTIKFVSLNVNDLNATPTQLLNVIKYYKRNTYFIYLFSLYYIQS